MGRVTLVDRFPEIQATMRRRLSADLKRGAEQIEQDASARIHSITGALDLSGEVKGQSAEFRVEFGGGDAYYAQWIEFGRKNAPPYPFLLPAAEAATPDILGDIQDTLNSL